MPGDKRGFNVAYASYKAMEADHAAYMTHGALIVRCQPEEAPEPKSPLALRIVSPDGDTFDFEAEAGHFLKKKGLMVSFESAQEARAKLDGHVKSDAFGSKVMSEDGDPVPPTVSDFDPSDGGFGGEPTPYEGVDGVEPFELKTPVDDAVAPFEMPDAGDPAPFEMPDAGEPAPFELPPLDDEGAAPRAGQGPPPGGTTLRRPPPGSEFPVYVVRYATVTDYAEFVPAFEKTATLEVPYAEENAKVNDVAMLRMVLPGRNQFEMYGVVERIEADKVFVRVDANEEVYRKACLYPTTIAARKRLENETAEQRGPVTVLRIADQAPDEDASKMPIRRRLARMGMDDKINLALSGNREERMAIAMDGNRAVHHYLLKNNKITLDEIAFMARLPSMNPDVLDKIAENPAYTQNPTVTKALVYNPKTPVRTAIRLLDRLPRPEVMNLSKRSNMNLRLVMAAKKKIERFKG